MEFTPVFAHQPFEKSGGNFHVLETNFYQHIYDEGSKNMTFDRNPFVDDPPLRLTVEKYAIETAALYPNIEVAERKFIDSIENESIDLRIELNGLVSHLTRTANLIAGRSRRGTGNIFLMHPRLASYVYRKYRNWVWINNGVSDTGKLDGIQIDFGRWTKLAYRFNGVTVFTCSDMITSDVVTIYRGNNKTDSACFVAKTSEGYRVFVQGVHSTPKPQADLWTKVENMVMRRRFIGIDYDDLDPKP